MASSSCGKASRRCSSSRAASTRGSRGRTELCRDGGEGFSVACFTPDPDSTRGEARKVAELARKHGWERVLARDVALPRHARAKALRPLHGRGRRCGRRRLSVDERARGCRRRMGEARAVRNREAGVLGQSPQSKSRVRPQRLSSASSTGSLARPGLDVRDDGGLLAAHRLLEARLLLGLEEGVVLERIAVQVAVDRVRSLDRRVTALQLDVIFDDLGEERRGLDGHAYLRLGCPDAGDCNEFVMTSQTPSRV